MFCGPKSYLSATQQWPSWKKGATLIIALLSSSLTFLSLLFWLLSSWLSLLLSMLSLLLAITIAVAIYFYVSYFANLRHFKCLVTLCRWLHTCWPRLSFHFCRIFAFILLYSRFIGIILRKEKKKKKTLDCVDWVEADKRFMYGLVFTFLPGLYHFQSSFYYYAN